MSDPQPFAEHDRQEYEIAQLKRQVSDLYQQLGILAQGFELLARVMNGKESSGIQTTARNGGLPARDTTQGKQEVPGGGPFPGAPMVAHAKPAQE